MSGKAYCPNCLSLYDIWSQQHACPHNYNSYASPAFARVDPRMDHLAGDVSGEWACCLTCFACYNTYDQFSDCPHGLVEPVEITLSEAFAQASVGRPYFHVVLGLASLAIVTGLLWTGAQMEREVASRRKSDSSVLIQRDGVLYYNPSPKLITIVPPKGMECFLASDPAQVAGEITCVEFHPQDNAFPTQGYLK